MRNSPQNRTQSRYVAWKRVPVRRRVPDQGNDSFTQRMGSLYPQDGYAYGADTAIPTEAQREEATFGIPAGDGGTDVETSGALTEEPQTGQTADGGLQTDAGLSGEAEDSAQKRRKQKLLRCLAGLAVVAVLALLVHFLPYFCVRKNITMEAGESIQSVSELLYWKDETAEIVSGIEEGEILSHVEERRVEVRLRGMLVTVRLQVVDTIPPGAELSDQSVYAGKAIPAEAFIEAVSDETDCTFEYVQEPEWQEVGTHTVTLAITDEGGNRTQKEAVLEILADTTPPVITGVAELTITEGDSFSYEEGITVSDNNDESVALEVDDSKAKPDVPGDYVIVYTAEDEAGNRTEISTMLHVKKADRTPPVIEGVQEITILKGESISYKRGVTVTDDMDENVTLEIDNSAVDTETPGDYSVIYSATDEAGNRTEVVTTVHVKEYVAKSNTGVEITEALVLEKADKILASILDDSMSDYERIRAIYDYVNKSIAYSNGTPKTNWVEGAYYGLVQSKGDCFAFAMASKCLLTRAGIANMDIERVRVGDSMHFWNLVDIGEGWHHFDTCRRGDGATFFYLTDAELMEYSEAHKTSMYPNGSHYYDRSLYPEIQ